MRFLQHIYCTHLRYKLNHLLFKRKSLPEPPISLRLKLNPLPMACRPLQPHRPHPSPSLTPLHRPLRSSSLLSMPTTSSPFPTQKGGACQKILPSGIFPKLCLLLMLQIRAGLRSPPGARPLPGEVPTSHLPGRLPITPLCLVPS